MSMTISVQVAYNNNGRTFALVPTVYTSTPGDALTSGVAEIGTSAEAIPLGGCAAPGMAVFTNLDATNYVEIGYDSTGFVAVMKVAAGATVVVSLDGVMAAPYAKADTAAVLVSYTIADKAA